MFKEMSYVYAVYQERSFTGAAKKMHLSQPALSAMVKKVERKIGTPIFDRSTSPITLTPAGKYYISQVEKILKIQRESEEYFHFLTNAELNQLRLGGSSFFQIYVFPPIILEFRKGFPDVTVSWVEARNEVLLQKLLSREIDAFPEVDNLFSDLVDGEVWDEEHLMLAVPSSWDINARLADYRLTAEEVKTRSYQELFPSVDLAEFADCPFILLREGNDSYERAMTICHNAGFNPKSLPMKADQMLTAYYLAAQGNGAVFVRDTITRRTSSSDSLFYYKLSDPAATRPVYLYYRKKDNVSAIAKAFREFVVGYRENCGENCPS